MKKSSLLFALCAVLIAGAAGSVAVNASAGSRSGQASATHHKKKKASKYKLAGPIARARAATAKYATDLEAAKADGYRIITRMIPDMGYHFLNPEITEFDVTKPPILVYVRNGDDWQLVGFEWVFPERPSRKPLPGAKYGSFGAACHYVDGTFVFEEEEGCPEVSPETGAEFGFWHPDLVTLHLWAWYPNPDGIYSGTNRWVRPFNDESV